jgi:hypothetical protein
VAAVRGPWRRTTGAGNDFLRSLGADAIAGDTLARSLDVLRPGGTLVSLPGGDPQVVANGAEQGIRVEGLSSRPTTAGMRVIADLVEAVFGHRLRRPAAGPEERDRPPSVPGSLGT